MSLDLMELISYFSTLGGGAIEFWIFLVIGHSNKITKFGFRRRN
jgi:hypothetical protein